MAKTKKPTQRERVNNLILREASRRAQALVKTYLSSHSMALTGADDFEKAMDAIIAAMMHMYSCGMVDVLDTVKGDALSVIEE